MARKTNKDKAYLALELWNRAVTAERAQWMDKMQECYDFYLDEQLTAKEKTALENAGMPTFTINRVTPIIQTMMYFVTANQPRWKAVGVDPSDAKVAEIYQYVADYCWNLSDGNSTYAQVVLDSLVKGIGYFFIDVDRNKDNGRGEVVFKHIDPFDVFVDPMSRDFLFRDAAFIQVRKNISKTQMRNLMPQFKAKIDKASGSQDINSITKRLVTDSKHIQKEDVTQAYNPLKGGEDDIILPYLETYVKHAITLYNVTFTKNLSDEQISEINRRVEIGIKELKAELDVTYKEKEAQLQEAVNAGEMLPERMALELEKAQKMMDEAITEQTGLLRTQAREEINETESMIIPEADFKVLIESDEIADRVVDFAKFYEYRISVIQSYADQFFKEFEREEKDYPIVGIPYMHSGTPFALSAVAPMKGKQEEINKAHQIMIHNANLASNMRWIYVEGSIDVKKWKSDSATPGALLAYRQGFDQPTPIFPSQLNNAFYQITQEGKGDIEYIAGMPSSMMGITKGAGGKSQHDTYRGLLANDEYGTRRIKAWMRQIVEPALEHLGGVFQQTSQAHYTADKIFRLVQPNPYIEQGKTTRINIPLYDDKGDEIGKYFDYETANFDVRIVGGATMPVNRWLLIDEYFKWYQAGLIDDQAMLAQTDIPDKEAISERNSQAAQMQQQLAQYEEALKKATKKSESLEGQLVQAGIKLKIDDANQEIKGKIMETDKEQKLIQGVLANLVEKAKNDIENAKEKAIMDVQNKADDKSKDSK